MRDGVQDDGETRGDQISWSVFHKKNVLELPCWVAQDQLFMSSQLWERGLYVGSNEKDRPGDRYW